MGELARAHASFFKEKKLLLPNQSLNHFFQFLKIDTIENFASHFEDSMHGDCSIGDEVARWLEYKTFRDRIKCD